MDRTACGLRLAARGGAWISSMASVILLFLMGSTMAGEKTDAPPRPAAGGAGHGEAGKPYDPREFTPEQRDRIEKLFARVICDCPRENWSKTLAGCPDGCSEDQKKKIREAVKRGLTDEQVLDEQLAAHGGDRRVLAEPDSPLASLFPYLTLGVLTAIVVLVLIASIRPRPAARPPAKAAGIAGMDGTKALAESGRGAAAEDERRIADAVEKDLQEME